MSQKKNSLVLSVIIISYNSVAYMEECLRSCLDALNESPLTSGQSEIIVIENGSVESSADLIREKFPSVLLHCLTMNKGYSVAVNVGAALSRGEYLLICNSDISFKLDSIHRLMSFMISHPMIAVSGPQLLFPNGVWQRSYSYLPGFLSTLANVFFLISFEFLIRRMFYQFGIKDHPRKVGYIDGAVMLVNRKVFDLLGGFDEAFFFYAEDVDFCVRARNLGYEIWLNPMSEVMHVRGGSSLAWTPAAFIEQRIKAQHRLVQKHCSPIITLMWTYLTGIHALFRLLAFSALRFYAVNVGNQDIRILADSRTEIWRAVLKALRELQ